MTFWQILIVIGIIVIPLIASIWLTLWTVEKRGRGPAPYYKPGPPKEEDNEARDKPAS
jgi:FtsZ-interacting cell division protein ZipA